MRPQSAATSLLTANSSSAPATSSSASPASSSVRPRSRDPTDRAAETRGLSNEQMDVLFGAVDADVRRDNIAAHAQHGDGSIADKEGKDSKGDESSVVVSVLPATS